MKISAIDIGSNSVRLMMWADGKTLYKRLATTRLGEGLQFSGRITPQAIERSANAIAQFKREAEEWGADRLYAFATAAVRSAENKADFLAAVYKACGVQVDVVSGEDEAKLGILGALKGGDGGIIDVGGASTEVTFQAGGKRLYSYSANIGTVRLFDKAGRDFKNLNGAISQLVREYPPFNAKNLKTYAIGGTATTAASVKHGLKVYDPAVIDGTVLKVGELEETAKKICDLSVEEVAQIQGMEPRRADVIGGGLLLLAAVMRAFGVDEVTVSESDNLEGYVMLKEGLV